LLPVPSWCWRCGNYGHLNTDTSRAEALIEKLGPALGQDDEVANAKEIIGRTSPAEVNVRADA
jgi:hypothetical protein